MNVSRFSTTPSTLSLFLRLLCRHVLGNSGSKVPPFLHKTRIIATKQVLVGTLGNEMIANRFLTDNTLSRTHCDFNRLLSVFQDAYTIFKRIHLELEFLITLNTQNAIDTAHQLIEILEKKGFKFFLKSPTNQQFVIVSNDKLQKLREHVATGFWEKYDENSSVIRFATS